MMNKLSVFSVKAVAAVTIVAALLSLTGCKNNPISDEALASKAGHSDVEGVKITVGEAAPSFSLKDHNGNTVSLADYQGESNVMLVFFRGHWCPFCVGHLEDIQTIFPKLKDYDVQLLGISPDNLEDAQEFSERFEQPYVFLSDENLSVTDLYGVRRDEKLPHPAVVVIDKAGKVAWFYVGENYRERPSSSQLEAVLKRLFPSA